jgi:hypothetical protein
MNRGGKRQATTPVGASFKDPRRENQPIQSNRFDALGDYESDGGGSWTEVPARQTQYRSNAEPSSQPDRPTFANIAAHGSNSNQETRSTTEQPRKVLERIFKTAPPDGPLRDNIVIEIRQVNGVPFKGSLHYKEAKYGIFGDCLKQDPSLIHGLSFAFSDYPIIKYKLKRQIDIDTWKPMEYFEFKRSYKVNGMEKTDMLQCKIKGIRSNYNDQSEEQDSDPEVRWVKIEWCDYGIEEHEILAWLEQFGEVIGHLTEDIYPDSDSDGDPTGNGTFTVKMKLHSPIPQLLPMWGKRIRIYYRGVQKLCPRCFGNHPRKNCKSEKRRWIDYVLEFMEHYQSIPNEIYGRWYKVINDEFGEIIQEQVDQDDTRIDEQPTNTERDSETPTTSAITAPRSLIQKKPAFISKRTVNTTRTNPISDAPTITREEQDNLADFLAVGMSLAEARTMKQNEDKLAAIKQQARELRRETERGAIVSRGSQSQTRFGPGSHTGRRGGLTFN